MEQFTITGCGDNLTIDGTRIGDLTPAEHETIEKERGGQNYHPLEDVVVSHVNDSTSLICRKPDPDNPTQYLEEEILDGHQVSLGLLSHGIYAKETHRNTIRLAPSLTISPEKIDFLADRIRTVIGQL